MELLKVREDRLKKNEERIKSIKSIYEKFGKANERHYHSERKPPETDTEDRRPLRSIKEPKQLGSDSEF